MRQITNGMSAAGALLLLGLGTGCLSPINEQSGAGVIGNPSGGFTVVEQNAPLQRSELRDILCNAIAAESGSPTEVGRRCRGFEFTLTQTAKSTNVHYTSSHGASGPGRLISVALAVSVRDPSSGQSWDRRLVRIFGQDSDLGWQDSTLADGARPNAVVEDPIFVDALETSEPLVPELNAALCASAEQDAACSFTVRRKVNSKLYLEEDATGGLVPLQVSIEAQRNGTGEVVRLIRQYDPELRLVWTAEDGSDAHFLTDLKGAVDLGYTLEHPALQNHLRAASQMSEGLQAALREAVADSGEVGEDVRPLGGPYEIVRSGQTTGWVVRFQMGGEGIAYYLFDANEAFVDTAFNAGITSAR